MCSIGRACYVCSAPFVNCAIQNRRCEMCKTHKSTSLHRCFVHALFHVTRKRAPIPNFAPSVPALGGGGGGGVGIGQRGQIGRSLKRLFQATINIIIIITITKALRKHE